MSLPDGFLKLHLQAQLVKDRHSLVRMGSLYSDEEEEVLETPPEKVQMTWTRERCEAEKINKRNAPENFRELMSLKPSVNFHNHLHLLSAPVSTLNLLRCHISTLFSFLLHCARM